MDPSTLGSGVIWPDAVDADALVTDLAARGWRTARCTVGGDTDKAGVIASIADALDFPDWTGRNLDALYDSLTDLSWVTKNKVLLVVNGSADLASEAGWEHIRSVFIDAAEWWQSRDRTLVIAIT